MTENAPPTDNVIAWLLDGDPAIRWQVMRDLLDELEERGLVLVRREELEAAYDASAGRAAAAADEGTGSPT